MFSIEEDPVRSPLREMVSSSILEVIRRKDYAATRTLVCGDKLSADDCSWCLMAACDVGWNEGIELLLENGAGTNAKTESGNTCLHFAAKSNCSSSCIRALIENGADPRAVNVGRNTPLLFAASSGAPRALETLVPYSSIDATERAGITALSATCLFAVNSPDDPNFRECLVLLLRAGANPAVRDHKGRTPLDILRSSARNGVIETMAADLRNRLDELEREAERQAADLIRDEQRLKTKTRRTARKIVRKQTIVGNNSSAENISPRSSRREDRGEDMVRTFFSAFQSVLTLCFDGRWNETMPTQKRISFRMTARWPQRQR